jgi:hypothetical protein
MSGGLCTGTVIGPYAVLTAKHCVFEERAGGSYRAVTPAEFIVVVGTDLTAMGGVSEVHYVAEVRTTPGTDIDADVENGYDIAVLILREAIGIAPRATATSGPTPGESATIVGFGRTSTTDADLAGIKYSGSTFIDRVGMRQLSAQGPSGTCQGDSGGPIIDSSGAVTGVTSFGFGTSRAPLLLPASPTARRPKAAPLAWRHGGARAEEPVARRDQVALHERAYVSGEAVLPRTETTHQPDSLPRRTRAELRTQREGGARAFGLRPPQERHLL